MPLPSASQQIDLLAYDLRGQLVGSSSIQVTTSAFNSVGNSLRVSEVHYNPAAPTAAERAAGWSDNEEFEFIELTNIGASPLQLGGVRFVRDIPGGVSEGIDFRFADDTMLAARQSIVVTANPQAFRARYGDVPIEGLPYEGQLSNGGEMLTLVDAGGQLIQQFAYDDAWYPETDGVGYSLQIRSPQTFPLDAWDTADAWMPSANVDGSPARAALPDFNDDGQLDALDVDQLCAALGSDDPRFDLDHNGLVNRDDVDFLVKQMLRSTPGDANLNGIFNSEDFVIVFQAGEYEDGIAGNSGWAEGDWNCDGDFSSSDMVLAFVNGGYVAEARLPSAPQRAPRLRKRIHRGAAESQRKRRRGVVVRISKHSLLTLLIFVGLVLGLIVGELLFRLYGGNVPTNVLAALSFVGDTFFMRLLKMILVPLVASSVIVGVASIGDPTRLGYVGLLTVAYYFATMVAAVIVGVVLVSWIGPGRDFDPAFRESRVAEFEISGESDARRVEGASGTGLLGAAQNILLQMIPENPVQAAAEGKLLPTIAFSLLLGIALTLVGERGRPVLAFMEGLFAAVMMLVECILWLAPLGVACLIAWSVAKIGSVALVGPVGKYMLTVLLGLAFHAFVTLPLVLWIFGATNPFRFLWRMRAR